MTMRKQVFRAILVLHMVICVPFTTSSCAQESPNRIIVGKENPPRFTFTKGEELGLLYVYHVPKNLLDEGVPGENLSPDNPDMVWWVEGKRRVNEPIIYGIVPVDMREVTPSRPLVEGEQYLVSGRHSGSGGTVGKYFVIRNGIPVAP